MKEQVQVLIENKKEEIREIELQKKEKHLRDLGLVDENKIERIESPYFFNGAEYDYDKRVYFKNVPVTLELSDEEYSEICLYYPIEEQIEKEDYSELKMKKDISTIKFWVIFWSILSIVTAFIAVIALMAN